MTSWSAQGGTGTTPPPIIGPTYYKDSSLSNFLGKESHWECIESKRPFSEPNHSEKIAAMVTTPYCMSVVAVEGQGHGGGKDQGRTLHWVQGQGH